MSNLRDNEEYIPRAFLVSRVMKDVSSASEYGVLTDVFDKNAHVPSIWSDQFQKVLINQLDHLDYDPKVDFIVVSGEMVTVSVAIAAIVASHEEVCLLCYDARSRNYTKVTVGE